MSGKKVTKRVRAFNTVLRSQIFSFLRKVTKLIASLIFEIICYKKNLNNLNKKKET